MRAIWKGSISFGFVNIPIGLHTATRSETLKFRMLRQSDLSPVNYKRVAAADGKEVPWEHIVKGYEYEKGKFIVLKDEDFQRVDVQATQTVDIIDFVELDEIDPMFFDKPYYLEPQKGGEKAYALLREALELTAKVGIAKVVIKTRQHLAALKPHGNLLLLELMHFEDQLVKPEGLKIPKTAAMGKKELDMAVQLINSLTDKWHPEKYNDDYRSALLKVIREKVAAGGKLPPHKGKAKPATNVIDLVDVLRESLAQAQKGSGEKGKPVKSKTAPAKKAKAKKTAPKKKAA